MNDFPRLIFWELTKQCNLHCAYCRVLSDDIGDELSTQEACSLINDVKQQFPHSLLVLSGGEPLLRKDLREVLAYALRVGVTVAVATNGTLLNEEKVALLADYGVRRVSLSLDCSDACAHDSSRGMEGAYAKVIDATVLLSSYGVPFQINVTVSKSNKYNLRSLAKLAQALGAVAIHFFVMVPVGCGRELIESDMLQAEETEEVLRTIEQIAAESSIEVRPTCAPQYVRYAERGSYGGCLAGRKVFFISSTGSIYPCGYFPVKAGSIRDTSIRDIWENAGVFSVLRKNDLKGGCGSCALKDTCRGCRARAYSVGADYMAADTTCVLNNPEIDEKDKELLMSLQKGIPIVERPYHALALSVHMSEDDVIERVKKLQCCGFLKRIDCRLNLQKMGISSTLVGCQVLPEKLPVAADVITQCKHITHNYTRHHPLNMWFTLSARSRKERDALLDEVKKKAFIGKLVHCPTVRILKLGFGLRVK